jgi:molecular chaperone DnaJ
VDTIDGKSECIVPPCTMNGAQLRMVRKGVPDVRTGMRGDQIVHIQVAGPKSLTDKQRQLLQEFEAEEQAKGGAGKGSSGAGSGGSGGSGGGGKKGWFS